MARAYSRVALPKQMIREGTGGRQSRCRRRAKKVEKLLASRLSEPGAIRRPPPAPRRSVRPPGVARLHDREDAWAWFRQVTYDPQPTRRLLRGQLGNGRSTASADQSRMRSGRF